MTTVVQNPGVPALAVTSVSKSFDGVAALNGCDLVVSQGSVTGLVGPNGAGKSTLLNVMSGLIRPDAGSLALFGHDVTGRPPRAMARAGLVRTFESSEARKALLDCDKPAEMWKTLTKLTRATIP